MANESKFIRNEDGSVSFEINDEKILSAKGKQAGISEVTADDIDSGTSTQGQILTSDGDGTASWMNNIIPKSITTNTEYSLLVGNNGEYTENIYHNSLPQNKVFKLFGYMKGNTFIGLSVQKYFIGDDSSSIGFKFTGSPRNVGSSVAPAKIELVCSDFVPHINLYYSKSSNYPTLDVYGSISLWCSNPYNTNGPYEGVVINTSNRTIGSTGSPYGGYSYYFSNYRKETVPQYESKRLLVAVEPTNETFTIANTDWISDANIAPFTHKTTITVTTTIATDTVVELVNNNAIAFATYGFSIGDVTNQVVTIYSIGQPSANIDFLIRVGN